MMVEIAKSAVLTRGYIPIAVKRKDKPRSGEYRTKRVILEIYDAMAEAIRTGKPYQTLLDPPPADPRVAHPARERGSEEVRKRERLHHSSVIGRKIKIMEIQLTLGLPGCSP